MTGTNEVEQNNADEAAKRAAEEARRREMMEKIRQLEQEKANCQDLRISFHGRKKRLEGILSKVNILKVRKIEGNIQKFSGAAADASEIGVADAQTVMKKKNDSFSGVVTAVETQIALLDSYIAELGEKIDVLRASI